MPKRPDYPFRPASTAYLEPGQFWAVPLEDGRVAAGRVLQLIEKNGRRDSRMFLAGLLRWVGRGQPRSESIAGSPLLECGLAHIRTIQETGGAILDCRPLAADGILLPTFVDASVTPDWVLHGATPIRRAVPEDAVRYPALRAWGYDVVKILAEKHLSEG